MDHYSNEAICRQWEQIIDNYTPKPQDSIHATYIDGAKHIVIYGAGKYARRLIAHLQRDSVKIYGIVVSSMDDNPQDIEGIPVYPIEEFYNERKKITVIIGSTGIFASQMVERLQELGFDNIVFWRFNPN